MRPLLVLLWLVSTSSIAHPHAWMSLKSEIHIHEHQWRYVDMTWYFDPMSSSQMVMGLNLTGQVPQDMLDNLKDGLVDSITSQNYFSQFQHSQLAIEPLRLTDAEIFQEKTEIAIKFRLELPEGLAVTSPFSWRTYESEYYVDMQHRALSDINITVSPQLPCTFSITEPVIDDDLLAYAENLDKSDNPSIDNLGFTFSQLITAQCSTSEE
ncbi:DUF1007 family protein [Thaumasiovibrio subtropicus]|uniref:DUF1007 family protein n=1 Tax=Thaumasiovibrio subtropicus TaxID=1891207 RepID=UPI000B354686|nr:DUF1007 family protein [Thaumasiovibrio subtropicus]